MDLNEVYRNSGLGKWFHGESANKTPGWDRYNSEGKLVGECGDAKKGESYSACLSKQKADKLGKEGRASFVKRKRAAQSEAGRGEKGDGGKGQKPINVDTGASKVDESYEIINESKNKPNDPEKWSACKSAAKSKFDVYPSAYANAWAAKCYKKKGGSWSTVKEETEPMNNPLSEIQQATKTNIISNILESKMKDGPGKTSQRPKSWDKGTKSGSEKRKMREQGKREAREMNEDRSWVYAAHDAFSGYISPADITTHFQGKEFPSIDHFKSAVKQLADDHADKFISTQAREGKNPEKEMQNWTDNIMTKFDKKIEQQNKAAQNFKAMKPSRSYERDDYDAARDQRAVDEFEGRRGRGSWGDYYDQPESWRESVEYRLRSMTEGWPDRESQRENAPHEYAIPDDISDYESQEKAPHDALHAAHYEDAIKTLKGGKEDIGHAKNLVMRGAIGAALGRASMGNSKDPTLRDVMSILRGTHDAMNDHFKQKQAEGDIPFEEAVEYGLIPVQDAIVIFETLAEASFEGFEDEWRQSETMSHPETTRGMQLFNLASIFGKTVKKKTGEYREKIKQTLTNDMRARDISAPAPRLNKQQSSFASQMGRSETERQVPGYQAAERRVNLAGAVLSQKTGVSGEENDKFVSGLRTALKAKGLSGKVQVRVNRETGKYHVTDSSGQTHIVDHYVFAKQASGLILESHYEIRN